MKSIYILFLALSLGALFPFSFGGLVYNVHYVELWLIFMFFVIMIKSWKEGITLTKSGYKHAYYVLFFLCFFYSILIYFWSDQGMSILAGSLSLFYGLMAFFLADYYFNKKPNILPTANRILITSLLAQLLYNMAKVGMDFGVMDFYEMKEYSTTLLGSSNYISFFFTFGLLYEFIAKEKKWMFFTILNLIGVVLTISRGAIVALVAAILMYFLIMLFNKNFKKSTALLSLAFLFFAFFLFVKYTIPGQELWFGFQGGAVVTSSVDSRTLLWNDTMNQIKEHPFGNGITWKDSPHNVFLTAFRDLGIFFGSVYLVLLAYPLFYFLRLKTFTYSKKTIALLVAYLSVFVHSLVEIFYFNTTSIIWTVTVLAYINKTISEEGKQANEVVEPVKSKRRRFKRYRLTW